MRAGISKPSEECKQMIVSMLTIDVAARPTMEEVLEMPFFRKYNIQSTANTINSLRFFPNTRTKLHEALLATLTLDTNEWNNFIVNDFIEKSGNIVEASGRYISREELKDALSITVEEIDDIWDAVAKDGKLGSEEVNAARVHRKLTCRVERVKAKFMEIDEDNSNTLSVHELHRALENAEMLKKMTYAEQRTEIKDMIKDVAREFNKDDPCKHVAGEVNYVEFITALGVSLSKYATAKLDLFPKPADEDSWSWGDKSGD